MVKLTIINDCGCKITGDFPLKDWNKFLFKGWKIIETEDRIIINNENTEKD